MTDWGRGSSSGAVDEMLDAENKRLAENLSTKVTRLKSLALDIDREADDHNTYLDGMDSVLESQVPRCSACGGLIKPDVFFGEQLPTRFFLHLTFFPRADLLIVMGTSLEVRLRIKGNRKDSQDLIL